MRIIAGTLRSRRLKTVEGEGYRPAMGKVRESLFSMLSSRLGSFEGLDVLDLFAGSGSLAFEALSRGASRAWFVETAQNAVRCLADNIGELGLADRAFIVKADVLKVVRRVHGAERGMGGPYGLVFLDPPTAGTSLRELFPGLPSAAGSPKAPMWSWKSNPVSRLTYPPVSA